MQKLGTEINLALELKQRITELYSKSNALTRLQQHMRQPKKEVTVINEFAYN